METPRLKTVDVSQLLINPKNPRFEPVKNQKKAIELMLSEQGDKIKKLAKDIAMNGLNPSKNLIVTKSSKDKFLVLEGNRRAISIKLLNNPTETENPKFREFFSSMHVKYLENIPTSVICSIFKNKDEPRHWISLEHSGENKGKGVVKWNTEQKDRFRQTGTKLLSLYDFADKNNIDRKDVDSTSIQRLISTSHVCDTIGISFSENILNEVKPKTEVVKNLKKVFAKMSEKEFNVRNIDIKKQREEWIDKIIGSTTSAKPQPKNTPQTATTAPKTNKAQKSTDRNNLIPKDCNLVISMPKINNIFLELKNDLVLDGRRGTPNAIGVLFRVFFETSINHYIKMKKITFSHNGPKIKDKINKTADHMSKNGIANKIQLKSIRKTAVSGNSSILSIEHFHDFVHSGNIGPEPEDLKIKWDNLQEFFEILWKNI